MNVRPIISNFTSGEIDPKLYGRVDVQKYYNACAILENLIVDSTGGVFRRPGTYYVGPVKTHSEKVRLIAFEFSTIQNYILEFGSTYTRIFANQGQIYFFELEVANAPGGGGWAPGDTLTGKTSGETCVVISVTDTTHYVCRTLSGEYTDGEDIWDGVDTAAGGASYPKYDYEEEPAEFTSPYATEHLFELQYAQSADVLYITHPNYAPRKLTRTGHDAWAFSTPSFYTDAGVTQVFNTTDNYPACVTFFEGRLVFGYTNNDPDKIWLSGVNNWEGNNSFNISDADNPAVFFRLASGKVDAIRWLLGQNILALGTIGSEWKLGDPQTAMTPTNPMGRVQTHNGSKWMQAILGRDSIVYVQRSGKRVHDLVFVENQNKHTSMDLTILASHIAENSMEEIEYQSEPDSIIWVSCNGKLLGLTYNREQNVVAWHRHITDGDFESVAVISTTDEDEIWVSVKRNIGGVTKRYIEYFKPRKYANQKDAFYVDCGLTSNHGTAINITGATKANPVVITAVAHGFLNNDLIRIRRICGMTEINDFIFMVKNKTTDTFELERSDDSGTIDGTGFIDFVGTVTGDIILDETTIAVSNIAVVTVGCFISGTGIQAGTTVIAKDNNVITISLPVIITGDDIVLTISGYVEEVANSVSGLNHLEGKNTHVLLDGGTHPKVEVSSGIATFDDGYHANKIQIGLPYTSKLQTVRPELAADGLTIQGRIKRVHRVVVRIHKSLGCKVGETLDRLTVIPFNTAADIMGDPPPLYTGDKVVDYDDDYGRDGQVMIVQDLPLPLNVLAIITEMGVS